MANTSTRPEDIKDKAREMGANAGQKVGDAAAKGVQRAQDTASNVTQQAKDAASNVAGQAQQYASEVGHKAQEYASVAKDKADDAISTVGDRMATLAGTLRESAPREGYLGTAGRTVADGLESGGRYLQQHGMADMTDDMASLVRRYPLQSLLVGFGVGFLLSQATSRR